MVRFTCQDRPDTAYFEGAVEASNNGACSKVVEPTSPKRLATL